jgi:hypothetical protein
MIKMRVAGRNGGRLWHATLHTCSIFFAPTCHFQGRKLLQLDSSLPPTRLGLQEDVDGCCSGAVRSAISAVLASIADHTPTRSASIASMFLHLDIFF